MIGQTLSHFRITTKLGEGGMGEVYRAEDTKLGREVAIKILPAAFTEDPERLARFEREAQVLAALNHPAIASIYDLMEDEGIHFLVLELVEGETLAEMMERGALPVSTAIAIARQLTEALEAAHGRGIVHRDLKPANIMVSPDNFAKVLDFGLAKPTEPAAIDGESTHSPTLTAPMTETGVILGTASYMSPEQARGQEVDKQADIWAFGVILWEMLAGRRLFNGDTVSDVLAAVLRADIDWSALPSATPPALRRLIPRCLEREPRQRLHDIADARIEVETASKELDEGPTEPGAHKTTIQVILRAGTLVAAGILLAFVVFDWMGRKESVPAETLFLNLDLPESLAVRGGPNWPSFALSPDGRTLVYATASDPQALRVRSLDGLGSRELPGTEGATQPFFSSDGQWVGFHAGGEIKKVPLEGGLVTTLCALRILRGAAWATDGTIYMGRQRSGILKLAPGDREPQPITQPDEDEGEEAHSWPQVLPGGRHLLFTVTPTSLRHADTRFAVLSLESGKIHYVHEGGISARYVKTGHLLYGLLGQVFAVPFDLESLEITGPARPVLGNVRMASPVEGSVAQIDVAPGGSMIFVEGYEDPAPRELVWIGRDGEVVPVLDQERPYEAPAISPSGEQIVVTIREGLDANLWIFDLVGSSFTRLTNEKDHYSTVWSADGQQLAFGSNRSGKWQVFTMPADGSKPPEQVTHAERGAFPSAWSPDGSEILADWNTPDRSWDVWRVPLSGDTPKPLVSSPGLDVIASFSPDGRWVVYASTESGQGEIYVQAYPDLGRKWKISRNGGSAPRWSRSGNEIFYWDYESGSRWVAVPVDTSSGFRAGDPVTAFSGPFEHPGFAELNYDHDAVGDRFLALRVVEVERQEPRLVYVTNWLDELARTLSP